MFYLKKSHNSFTLIELTIYIALFGILTFVLFNIFGSVVNLGNLAKKQNENIPIYVSNPIRITIPFTVPLPSDLNPLPKPVIPLPPDKPVLPEPGPGGPNWQFCQTELIVNKCDASTDHCYVCKCDETACNNVTGCQECHMAFVNDPLHSEACECEDMKSTFESNLGGQGIVPFIYSYNIFDPSQINIVPLPSDDWVWNPPLPPGDIIIFPIDHYYRFTWNNHIGWIDFGNVKVNMKSNEIAGTANVISGGDTISFNCNDTGSCAKSNYKVTVDTTTGDLHGYAWSDNYGWFSLNCLEGSSTKTSVCSTSNYKVSIDQHTGEWSGYAWNDNIGWISFNCETGGTSQTNVCATSNYKVMDSRSRNGILSGTYTGSDGKKVTLEYPYNSYREWNITSMTPISGTSGTSVTVSGIAGEFFYDKPLVELIKSGSNPIFPSNNFTYVSQDLISNGTFDLRGVTPGKYDLRVTDFYGNVGIKKDAFTVE